MRLFDTHCHLAGSELKSQAVSLSQSACDAGVFGLALIAADVASLDDVFSVKAEIQSKVPTLQICATTGLHPHEVNHLDEALWAKIEEFSDQADAIGETGLDFFYDHGDKDRQFSSLIKHIDLAKRKRKPLVIHCRQAKNELLEVFTAERVNLMQNPGVMHCFAEDWEAAKKFLDLGFFISFAGILSFKNADALRSVARKVPLDRLLIETDSPWLAPVPHRGKKNEPAFLRDLFHMLSGELGIRPDELWPTLWENSCRLYQIKH